MKSSREYSNQVFERIESRIHSPIQETHEDKTNSECEEHRVSNFVL